MSAEPKRLRITGDGVTAVVELDGVEIQHGVIGLELTMGYRELPRLRLDPLIVTTQVEHDGPVVVQVPPTTHETLVALGWTPPKGGGS